MCMCGYVCWGGDVSSSGETHIFEGCFVRVTFFPSSKTALHNSDVHIGLPIPSMVEILGLVRLLSNVRDSSFL